MDMTFASSWKPLLQLILRKLSQLLMLQIHYKRFPVKSPQTGKLPTCCGLVSDTANTSASSWQQVVVMEFRKRHGRYNGLLSALTCYGLVVCCGLVKELLYGGTCVMDFGLIAAQSGQSPQNYFLMEANDGCMIKQLTCWSPSTQLLYTGLGYYLDG